MLHIMPVKLPASPDLISEKFIFNTLFKITLLSLNPLQCFVKLKLRST